MNDSSNTRILFHMCGWCLKSTDTTVLKLKKINSWMHFILKLRELTWIISKSFQKNPPDNIAKPDKVYKSPKSIKNKVN